jgi:hypothetical protein
MHLSPWHRTKSAPTLHLDKTCSNFHGKPSRTWPLFAVTKTNQHSQTLTQPAINWRAKWRIQPFIITYLSLFIKLSHRITLEVFFIQDKISFFKLWFGFFLVNWPSNQIIVKNSILSGQKKTSSVITVEKRTQKYYFL